MSNISTLVRETQYIELCQIKKVSKRRPFLFSHNDLHKHDKINKWTTKCISLIANYTNNDKLQWNPNGQHDISSLSYQYNVPWHSNPSKLDEQSDDLPNQKLWTWFSQCSTLLMLGVVLADVEPASAFTILPIITIKVLPIITIKLHP